MDNSRETINQSATVKSSAARLFYVIGPSGAGKDSVMNLIRDHWSQHIVIAHRYITRDAGAGNENHVALSQREFTQRKEKCLFALDWQANGYCYGIGCEVDTWLKKGVDVMVNGSRAHLKQAQQRYGSALVPVVITVESEILKSRLIARGRESLQEIEQRLIRAKQLNQQRIEGAILLDNSGCLEQTIEVFNVYYQQRLEASDRLSFNEPLALNEALDES
ncbi:ribose 1,5-bisphosphokinase [Vibrio rumoiensis]|uniref:Ribose 1,5-bisphosphate phosphokinase PhnN n=1 Tax=Vibrio rumoiensis 1S-45 TaxID=1188252 RepID=A0A1E5E5G4_9VIBR|nr:ribose 1,5-bisphosphokinase [Vibrio rumoiensis]OEF28973.1 phosphonate metabolism protein/1,5-bisphosphokinase (PRPP-forming) PhnN [Vibrio rumoiensis 1S-45]